MSKLYKCENAECRKSFTEQTIYCSFNQNNKKMIYFILVDTGPEPSPLHSPRLFR